MLRVLQKRYLTAGVMLLVAIGVVVLTLNNDTTAQVTGVQRLFEIADLAAFATVIRVEVNSGLAPWSSVVTIIITIQAVDF
jgi:hypothetical protein